MTGVAFPSASGDWGYFSGATVTPPANTADGDVLIAWGISRNGWTTEPSGWTKVASWVTNGTFTAYSLPVPSAAAVSAGWTWAGANSRWSVLIFRVTGASLATPVSAAGGTSGAGSDAGFGTGYDGALPMQLPGVTHGGAWAALVGTFFTGDGSVPASDFVPGATRIGTGATPTSPNGRSSSGYYAATGSAGSTGTITTANDWPTSPTGQDGILIALNPATTPHSASASLTVAPSLSASRVVSRVRSAALSLAVTLSAAAGVTRPRPVSLTVSPVLSASPAAVHVRAAALTVSPVLGSAALQVRGRGAALVISPVLSAGVTGTSFRTRTAALTVTPVLHVAAQHTGSGALLLTWPDVERALGDFLSDLGTTGTETPLTLQTSVPWIRITRTGGTDDRITDRASVSIDVFAQNASDAKQAAHQIRERLLTRLPAATGHGQLDWASTTTGPTSLPPTDSGRLRLAVASYTVSMRRMAQ